MSESPGDLPRAGRAAAPFYVDPQTLSGLPLSQVVARVGMLEVALRASEDRLRLLVDAVTEYAIFTLDPDGVIESWNTGAERMTGHTHDEAVGQHFSILYPVEDRDGGLPQDLLEVARTNGTRAHTGWQVRKDGTAFWSGIVISSMLEDRGHHTGFVQIVRDLTEQHRLEAAKNAFYNAFQHDFKMPITAIRGYAEMLRDVDPQEQGPFVDRIESNAHRLLSMVEELIDYARLRSGQVPISVQPVDLAALVRRAVAGRPQVQVLSTAPLQVLADPTAMECIVESLVTAALEHSPGAVTIAFELVDGMGVLRISDPDRGTEHRDLSSVFVEFERGQDATGENPLAPGEDPLDGLTSVQRLIELQGGMAVLTNQGDAGTTVTLRLPAAPTPAPSPDGAHRPALVRPRAPSHLEQSPAAQWRSRVGRGKESSRAVRAGAARARAVAGGRIAPEQALADLLERAHVAPDHALPELFHKHGLALGANRVVAYLVDLQQRSLAPFVDPRIPAPDTDVHVLSVDRTLAGRAFQQLEVVTQLLDVDDGNPDDALQVWLPLIDNTERLGVLAVTLPDADALEIDGGALRARLLTFASVAAELVATKMKYGDSVVRLRRSEEMSLAAEMQWSLLPPLTFVSDEVTVTCGVEPAYEVGGDTLDYSVDPGVAHLAVFDAMGHGLPSTQLSALAVSAYRNARRRGLGMVAVARYIDSSITSVFGADAFATGVVVELNTETGLLQWINAGHPPPLLLRNGRLIRALPVEPLVPFGLGTMVKDDLVHVGREHLEPGDMVLLHSDGVIEARSPHGGFFGTDQLVALVTRHLAAGLSPAETMRRVTSTLLAHHQDQLSDDASLLLLQYRPRSRSPQQRR